MTTRRLTVLLLSLAALAACTPNVPYRFKGYENEPELEKYRNRADIRPPLQTCWVGVGDGTELLHQQPPCDEPRPPGEDEADVPDDLESWRYHLSVVEFDDLGDFWLRQQLERELQCLLYELTAVEPFWLTDSRQAVCDDYGAAEAPDDKGKRSAIVTVFIHGWKHNASPKNEATGNLRSFHEILRTMAQGELARAGRCADEHGLDGCEVRPREIIGVYIGWRGKSFARIPFLQEFTIFNRRAAAERVGRVAASHTIHRIVNWTKESNRKSRAILVGHSLGGVILENVLTRSATVEREERGRQGEEQTEERGGRAAEQSLPADLAFLINPANEAILAEQTIDVLGPPAPRVLAEHRKTGEKVEAPTIVSIASPGDQAVRLYFPISQRLKAIFGLRKFKPGQRFLFTHTPGFSDDPLLMSHEFARGGGGSVDEMSLHSITPPPRVALDSGRCRLPAAAVDAGGREKILRWRRDQLGERVQAIEKADEKEPAFCLRCISYSESPRVESRAYDAKEQQRQSPARDSGPGEWTIERRADTLNLSPYWVMRVDTDLVGSHTDIFNSRVIAFISAMVSLKQGIFDVTSVHECTGSGR